MLVFGIFGVVGCGECVGAMGGVELWLEGGSWWCNNKHKNLTFFEFSQIHVFSFTFKSIVNER